MIRHMLILGATGDLTFRYLLPALAQLRDAGELPEGFTISALGHHDWDTESYRAHVGERLARHAADVSEEARSGLAEAIEYHRADVTNPERVRAALGDGSEGSVVAYLALPPSVFAPAIEVLKKAGLAEGSLVVVEKPFGEDLEAARNLNRLLHETFPEEAVFRADHFLGLQTVQNVLGLRFANRVFEPVWNHDHVERVEIVWDETLALEGRAGYYDTAGALKDMIQNHLLQLLCLVGMEPPITLHEHDLRDRKVDLLRAVRRLSPEEAKTHTVRARYGAGRIGEKEIPAYTAEEGVDPSRGTETFAQVTLMVDNLRWAGVPFVLRGGKALSHFRGEIAVHFKAVPHLAFQRADDPRPNVLRVGLGPDRVTLNLNVNGPYDPFDLECIELGADFAPQEFFAAYERLFLDLIEGNTTLFVRADEAEEAWRGSAPILDAWGKDLGPLLEYPAGSDGPNEAAFPPRRVGGA